MPTDFRYIPGGICSRSIHDDSPRPLQGKSYIRCMGGRFCTHAPGTCTASPEYQAMIKDRMEDLVPEGPLPKAPPTDMHDQVALAIENSGSNTDKAATAVLSLSRIRDALKLMDDVDSGVVELITYGSKPESSDAR